LQRIKPFENWHIAVFLSVEDQLRFRHTCVFSLHQYSQFCEVCQPVYRIEVLWSAVARMVPIPSQHYASAASTLWPNSRRRWSL
jgi:hypothetical protein